MKYVTQKTADELVKLTVNTEEEFITMTSDEKHRIMIASYSSRVVPEITEPEMYKLVSTIVSEVSAMLEADLNDSGFDLKVVELVKQCNQDQLQQMYCNMLNKVPTIPIKVKRASKPIARNEINELIFSHTMNIYVTKLRENNIKFEVFHDSVAIESGSEELCKKLLKYAELEANELVLGTTVYK